MKVFKNVYQQPKPGPLPNSAGYPNNMASTQTVPTRGKGAAIRGSKSSKKLG